MSKAKTLNIMLLCPFLPVCATCGREPDHIHPFSPPAVDVRLTITFPAGFNGDAEDTVVGVILAELLYPKLGSH